MKKLLFFGGIGLFFFASPVLWSVFFKSPSSSLFDPISGPPESLKSEKSYGMLPLYFEPNQGQADPQVKYLARGSGYNLYLTSNEAVLVLNQPHSNTTDKFHPNKPNFHLSKPVKKDPPTVLRIKLSGSNPNPTIEGKEKLSGISNYFIGNDPSKWHTNIPNYAKIKLKNVYPGIDMVYYGNQGHLEYDFVVAPGADLKMIQLVFEGLHNAKIDSKGSLCLKGKKEDIEFEKPLLFQMESDHKKIVAGSYVMGRDHKIGFKVQNYDRSRTLLIDPILDYSTYLGSVVTNIFQVCPKIIVDALGNAYIVGATTLSTFPTTTGSYQSTFLGSQSAFVTKLNTTGTTLIYSTYLGGNNVDAGLGIALDSTGNTYITGYTNSSNFPTTSGAYQSSLGGTNANNAFVAKLNSIGTSLLYSTYLGGSDDDEGHGICLDSTNNVYVTGVARSSDFPITPGVFQNSLAGLSNPFVAKLNSTGMNLVYSTFLGGSDLDQAFGIALDSSGNAYITGIANSSNFPTTSGAFQTSPPSIASNSFLSKLNQTASALVYSTYLGDGWATAITVDASGNAYLTGFAGGGYPTTPGAFQTLTPGNTVFVSKINPAGTALIYSTALGGSNFDQGNGISINPSGNAYITGYTTSSDFPITANAYQKTLNGTQNSFLTEFNASGSSLIYSTYLGGNNIDSGQGIALDNSDDVYLTGYTTSTNFPTTSGAFQTSPGGAGVTASFISKFDKSAFTTPTFTPTSTPAPSYNGKNNIGPGQTFVYPSPVTGYVINIAYDMEESGTAEVSIWNESAELVTDVTQDQWLGTQKTTIQAPGWARGVYFYRVILRYASGKIEKLSPGKFLVWQ